MKDKKLLSREKIGAANSLAMQILEQLNYILLGRDELHKLVLTGIIARGHILMEGLPGLGKTALIHALGEVLGLKFSRVQFTPDLMPSDILGAHILQKDEDGERQLKFSPGPVFTNILLADEINRASPKTQSALLETMQEKQVTLMGTTRKLPDPFFVLASQNPIELEGTYPLPEAQLDRFMFKVNVCGLPAATMTEIILDRRQGKPPQPTWRINQKELDLIYETMQNIFLPPPIAEYIGKLVEQTHPQVSSNQLVKQYVQYGASPRAAIALAESARAIALISNRPSVGYEDVNFVAEAVLNHRMILNYKARFDSVDVQKIIGDVIKKSGLSGSELNNIKIDE